jgi:integrase
MPNSSYNYTEVIKRSFDPNPMLRAAAKEAGLRESDLHFHSLRHTWATLALEAGRSPALVSKALGHSSLSTTLDLYWQAGDVKIDLGFLDAD